MRDWTGSFPKSSTLSLLGLQAYHGCPVQAFELVAGPSVSFTLFLLQLTMVPRINTGQGRQS